MKRPRDIRSTASATRRVRRARGAAGPRTLLLAGGLILLVGGGLLLASGALEREDGASADRDGAAAAADGTGETRAAAPPRAAGEAGTDAGAEAGPREAAASPGAPTPGGGTSAPGAAAAGPARADATDTAAAPEGAGAAPSTEGASPREAPTEAADGRDHAAGAEAAPGQASAPDVERLLARAEEVYSGLGSLRASFRQEIEVPLLERHREGHGVWLQKGRGRFKMDFTDPPEDVIVADGEHLWLYYPSTNPRQVIRSGLEAPQTRAGTADVLARILAEARTNYAATYAGTEPVAGVRTHVVELRPVGRSPYRQVTVWIGAEDHLVRRFRIVERNETVRTVTLTDLRPNAPIPDSAFRFTPPPDADVFSG